MKSETIQATPAYQKILAEDAEVDAIRDQVKATLRARSEEYLGEYDHSFCLGALLQAVATAIQRNDLEPLRRLMEAA